MSLFGFSASKNPPTLSGTDSAKLGTATINDLTITDKLYFQPAGSADTGNLAFNMSVNPVTDDLTINTPQLSSIKYVLGTDATHQETLFAINPTSLNFNVSNDLKTLTYDELWTLDGAASNIQQQIDSINTSISTGSAYWGSFYSTIGLTNNQNGGAGNIQYACMNGNDPNTNGFYLDDLNATYTASSNSIVVENAGYYNIVYQARPSHTSTITEPNRIWLRLNGTDITRSAIFNGVPPTSSSYTTAYNAMTLNWSMYLSAGDKIQPMWASASSGIQLSASSSLSTPSTTGVYSVLVNIQQIVSVTAGPQGPVGNTGTAATVSVGSTTTLAAGSSATVSNSGTTSAAVFNFGIPQGVQGLQGNTGSAATVSVGSTTTLSAGSSATVSNSGTSSAAVFNFGIPQGIQGIQGLQGNNGLAATINVGSTTTLAAGSSATVSNSGTSSAAVFNFGIPKGVQGDQGPQGPQGPQGTTPDLSNYATHTELSAAITANNLVLTSVTIPAEIAGALTAYTTDVIDPLLAPITADLTTLDTKTENQTAVPNITTFAGQVNTGTLDVDYIALTTQISGIGKLNLISTSGGHLIQAPSTTINSASGAGGIYLGGYTDTVYLNGFPFAFYLSQQW